MKLFKLNAEAKYNFSMQVQVITYQYSFSTILFDLKVYFLCSVFFFFLKKKVLM